KTGKKKSLTAIRRRSKTPGVMITQYSASLPEGKSTPDFQCKPVPVTIPEGKLAVFRAVVTGDPKPDVSWRRAKGTITDKEKFQRKYDESTGEHILEIYKVTATESDTYKCSAVNEYGKAVCTTTLSVIDVFRNVFILSETTTPADFRKLLKKSKEERAGGENDEKFWDALLNAERKDYERICKENGITDLHLILKKLEEKKKQRGQNKHRDLRSNGVLQNESGLYPSLSAVAQINISNQKLNQPGTEEDLLLMEFKRRFYRNNLGCSAVAILIYNHVFAVSNVDFVIKIQEINVEEADNALFECVLTHPLPQITWMRKGLILEDGEKYSITVSEHKLIHRLMIKDCNQTDKGIYSAVAGITSCSAWLVVEDHKSGEKLVVTETASKDCDLRCAPTFIVPLKLHTATRGYECYMSCAVKGNPSPHITWYRNHVSLNTNTNYYISNTCGVCSLAILSVGPKDMGEYTVIAENSLGRAECSTLLSVRGEWGMGTHSVTLRSLILIFLFCLSFRLNKLRTSVIR
uniref:Ig-like domain-containing protein n=1 Tax=Oryzias latipes TaxID=8090 RepID=A0A3P9HLV2_ORYLA